MLIIHVYVQVKPECIEEFKAATLVNVRASLKEPGVLRFDVIQELETPAKFVFIEVYRDAAANAAHKETAHYPVWRDTVAPMMAEPRFSVKYNNVYPKIIEMKFEFATPTRIIFGAGATSQLGPAIKSYGHRALIVTGHNPQRAGRVLSNLAEHNVGAVLFAVGVSRRFPRSKTA